MLLAARFADMLAGQQFAFRGWGVLLSILRTFRGLLEALQLLVAACQAISVSLAAGLDREGTDDEMREQLRGLLLSQAKWEAEMEGALLKADSTLKAAANAESRQRTMVKHAEKLLDPLGEESEDDEEAIRGRDAPRGEEEGLQRMRVDVAPNYKENALRFKFG